MKLKDSLLKPQTPYESWDDYFAKNPDMCRCDECGWVGPVSSCESYTETESWEMPHIKYTVFICPVCSLGGSEGCISDFWNSIAVAFDEAATEEMGEDYFD